MNIFVFDDKYWEKISTWLLQLVSNTNKNISINIPIQHNITNPLIYLDDIKKWDIILLDNWFIQDHWFEEEYWEYFLKEIFTRWYDNIIISISDNTKDMLSTFEYWKSLDKKWQIQCYIISKDVNEIYDTLKWYLK